MFTISKNLLLDTWSGYKEVTTWWNGSEFGAKHFRKIFSTKELAKWERCFDVVNPRIKIVDLTQEMD